MMNTKLKVSCCSSLFSILCALLVLSATGAVAGEAAVKASASTTSNASSLTTVTGSTLVELSRRALRGGGGGGGSGRCDLGDGSRSESFVFWCQFSWKVLVGVMGFVILLALCWYYRYLRNNKSKHKLLHFDEALSFEGLYDKIKVVFQEKSNTKKPMITLWNSEDRDNANQGTSSLSPKEGYYTVEYLEDNGLDEDRINDTIYLTFRCDNNGESVRIGDGKETPTNVKSVSGHRDLFTIDEGEICVSSKNRNAKTIAWWLESQQQHDDEEDCPTTTASSSESGCRTGGGGRADNDDNEIIQVINWVTYDPIEKVFNGEWWSRSGLHGTLKAYYSIFKNKKNRNDINYDHNVHQDDEEAPPSVTSSIDSNFDDDHHYNDVVIVEEEDGLGNSSTHNSNNNRDIYFGSSDDARKGVVSLHNVIRHILNNDDHHQRFGETMYRKIRKELGSNTRFFVRGIRRRIVDEEAAQPEARGRGGDFSSRTWREVTYEEKELVKLIRKEFNKLNERNQE